MAYDEAYITTVREQDSRREYLNARQLRPHPVVKLQHDVFFGHDYTGRMGGSV
jgi:hypothetical protein